MNRIVVRDLVSTVFGNWHFDERTNEEREEYK